MSEMDEKYSERIKAECDKGWDKELNGCNLDSIMRELLNELGMSETLKAFDDVDFWRA